MIVQHNMSALNTNRQLGVTNSSLAKSTEKLSSGYRINRAGDDAAGLSISEKMRGQIRGLSTYFPDLQEALLQHFQQSKTKKKAQHNSCSRIAA